MGLISSGSTRPLEILSLGAGVQSTTVLLMSCAGKLPRLDEAIRNSSGMRGQLFLHRSCRPLREVDLRSDFDKGQLSLLDECSGICGV